MTPEEIKNKLERAGISRYQLAKDYGLDQAQLSKIYSGEIKISRFAEAFFKLLFECMEDKPD